MAALTITIGGVDYTAYIEEKSIRIETSGTNLAATATLTVKDRLPAAPFIDIDEKDEITIVDAAGPTTLFAGRVGHITQHHDGPLRSWTLRCSDFTLLLEETVIQNDFYGFGTSDIQMISALFWRYLPEVNTETYVQTLRAIMPALHFRGTTLRLAMQAICQKSGGLFYVDFERNLHYFAGDEGEAAPFGLSTEPAPAATYPYGEFELRSDATRLANRILVVGKDLYLWVEDAASIALYGEYEATITDDNIITESDAEELGNWHLNRLSMPAQEPRCVCWEPGLRAGMTLTLTNSVWAITAEDYAIRKTITSCTGGAGGVDDPQYEVRVHMGVHDAPGRSDDPSPFPPPTPGDRRWVKRAMVATKSLGFFRSDDFVVEENSIVGVPTWQIESTGLDLGEDCLDFQVDPWRPWYRQYMLMTDGLYRQAGVLPDPIGPGNWVRVLSVADALAVINAQMEPGQQEDTIEFGWNGLDYDINTMGYVGVVAIGRKAEGTMRHSIAWLLESLDFGDTWTATGIQPFMAIADGSYEYAFSLTIGKNRGRDAWAPGRIKYCGIAATRIGLPVPDITYIIWSNPVTGEWYSDALAPDVDDYKITDGLHRCDIVVDPTNHNYAFVGGWEGGVGAIRIARFRPYPLRWWNWDYRKYGDIGRYGRQDDALWNFIQPTYMENKDLWVGAGGAGGGGGGDGSDIHRMWGVVRDRHWRNTTPEHDIDVMGIHVKMDVPDHLYITRQTPHLLNILWEEFNDNNLNLALWDTVIQGAGVVTEQNQRLECNVPTPNDIAGVVTDRTYDLRGLGISVDLLADDAEYGALLISQTHNATDPLNGNNWYLIQKRQGYVDVRRRIGGGVAQTIFSRAWSGAAGTIGIGTDKPSNIINFWEEDDWLWTEPSLIDLSACYVHIFAYSDADGHFMGMDWFDNFYLNDPYRCGEAAINRANQDGNLRVILSCNPARVGGTITNVDIFLAGAATSDIYIGTFHTEGSETPGRAVLRDVVNIGQPAGGLTQHVVGLAIERGDMIGVFLPAAHNIDTALAGGEGYASVAWDGDIEALEPDWEANFTYQAGRAVSLYAYGFTEAAMEWAQSIFATEDEGLDLFNKSGPHAYTSTTGGGDSIPYNCGGVRGMALFWEDEPGQLNVGDPVETYITYPQIDPLVGPGDKKVARGFHGDLHGDGQFDELLSRSIGGGKIIANTITADEIAAGTITAIEIAALTITAAKIAALTITAGKIAANAIETDKLNALAVTAAKIAALTITAGKIAAGAIETDKLDALAVTAEKIAANTITAEKIAANTITANQIAALTITAGEIAAGAIETDKLDALAVTAVKIAAEAITAEKILANTITTNKFNIAIHWVDGTFTDNSPSAGYIAWSGVTVTFDGTTYNITNGNTNKKIVWWDFSSPTVFQTTDSFPTLDAVYDIIVSWNNVGTHMPLWQVRSVHGENLIAETITAEQIAANAILAVKIAAKAITVEKLDIASVTDNMVLNPSFEQEGGWAPIEGGSAARSSSFRTDGTWSALAANSGSWGCRAIPLTPGVKYTVRVKTLGATAEAQGLVIIMEESLAYPSGDYVTAGNRDSYTSFHDGAITNGWQTWEYTYTVPATNVRWGSFGVFCRPTGPAGGIYFDEAEVRRQLRGVHIQDGAITAGKITVDYLSAIKANMGTLTAGTINMFTGTWDSNATGFRLNATEIAGQNAGVDQVRIAAATGKLTAGAGVISLDAGGLHFTTDAYGTSYMDWWRAGGAAKSAEIKVGYGEAGLQHQTFFYHRIHAPPTGAGITPLGTWTLTIRNYLDTLTHSALSVGQRSDTESGRVTLTARDANIPALGQLMYECGLLYHAASPASDLTLDLFDNAAARTFHILNSAAGRLAHLNIEGNTVVGGKFALGAATELTIAAGVITVTKSFHRVDTEGDDPTDDLVTILGGVDGAILVLCTENAAHDVTVKDSPPAAGNIELAGGDFTLDIKVDKLTLIYDPAMSKWCELSRANNA